MGAEMEQSTSINEHSAKGVGALQSYLRIFRYGTFQEYTMLLGAAACAVGSGVGIALFTYVSGLFINVIIGFRTGSVDPATFRRAADQLALYFFLIGVVRFILAYGYSTMFTIAAYRITRNIRYQYFKSGLRQETAFHDTGNGGSIAMQVTSNGKLIQIGISEKLGLVVQGISAFISSLVLALVIQWKLALICSCIAPATFLGHGSLGAIHASIEKKVLRIQAHASILAESMLSSARTIHAFGIRSRLLDEFNKVQRDSWSIGQKKSPLVGCLLSVDFFIIYAGYGLCYWQGTLMVANGEVKDVGDVFIVAMAICIGCTNLTSLSPYFLDFTRAGVAASDLFRLIDRTSAIDPFFESKMEPPQVTGDIEFEDVSFSYPTRPRATILREFSIHIPAGKTTALVGPSGSGKSTIIGLIERWYNPSSGTIRLDGRPIDQLSLRWLRRQIGLVQQEPVLFSGTIFANIANGLIGTEADDLPMVDKYMLVHEAAKVAFAHDFIEALPDGYATVIGERGALLSGGQKQRIVIARSIVSNPSILLLDEATSELDPHSEEIVQRALQNASQGRTTIMIAHRLATIQNADHIIVMEKGRICEEGHHSSLLAANGVYTSLVQAQNLSVSTKDTATSLEHIGNQDKENLECPMDELVCSPSISRGSQEKQADRYDFDKWESRGNLGSILGLLGFAPELKMVYLLVFVSCLIAAAAYPGQSILLAYFVNVFQFTGEKLKAEGSFLSLMFFVMSLGCLLVYFIMGSSTNFMGQTITHKFRGQLIDNILKQDVNFFDRIENAPGALLSGVFAHSQALFELTGYTLSLSFIAIVGVWACCILAVVYSWKLGLVIGLGGLVPTLLTGYARMRMENTMDCNNSRALSTSTSIASEAVNAIRTVSSLSMEASMLERYARELNRTIADSTKAAFGMWIPFAFTQGVENCLQALGFWYGCRMISVGDLEVMAFFVAFQSIYFAGQQASAMFGFSGCISRAKTAANYMFWLEQMQPSIRQTDQNHDIGAGIFPSIHLTNIQFSYPMRPDAYVLRGINLHITKGQFVAFVGASGSGKSTMIGLLERFYDPVAGEIRIGPTPLSAMNPWLYRKEVALVQQEPTLYPGSIRENIALGIPTPQLSSYTDSHIEAACRAANAWDFISSLPDGLQTLCGTNGIQLSGGQRQRIAIARALVRNPRLLLLDEATSAMDTQSERMVQEALNEAASQRDRITIAIAHRLSTIRHADMICVFDEGRIVESGTHQQLLARGQVYAKMCEAQNLGTR